MAHIICHGCGAKVHVAVDYCIACAPESMECPGCATLRARVEEWHEMADDAEERAAKHFHDAARLRGLLDRTAGVMERIAGGLYGFGHHDWAKEIPLAVRRLKEQARRVREEVE